MPSQPVPSFISEELVGRLYCISKRKSLFRLHGPKSTHWAKPNVKAEHTWSYLPQCCTELPRWIDWSEKCPIFFVWSHQTLVEHTVKLDGCRYCLWQLYLACRKFLESWIGCLWQVFWNVWKCCRLHLAPPGRRSLAWSCTSLPLWHRLHTRRRTGCGSLPQCSAPGSGTTITWANDVIANSAIWANQCFSE